MGFGNFLIGVGRIVFGYGGGLICALAASVVLIRQGFGAALPLYVVGVLLALYGLYSERDF